MFLMEKIVVEAVLKRGIQQYKNFTFRLSSQKNMGSILRK